MTEHVQADDATPRINTAQEGSAEETPQPSAGDTGEGGSASCSFEENLTIEEPEDALPPAQLASLPGALQEACVKAGWAALMPVQARALPYLLAGRDIMVQSRTGSGKTGAYLLPMLDRLNPDKRAVQALVLVPTRELAVQVEREASTLLSGSGISVAAVYGGVAYGKQNEALRQGVSIVVGTPGRVLDHLLRRTLVLDQVSTLVFDEADRMLSIGFYPDMKEIQRYLPARAIHATLFSATYPPHVLRLAGEFLKDPQLLSLSASQVHVAEVQHLYCECKRMDKDRTLLRIIEVENPASAIIFCNTKSDVHFVTAVLQGFGLNADELSADLSQNKREEVLGRLRKSEIRFLVATDVAARGIDIPELSHVILYSPPEDRESYIHRAGRTGRAGAAGVVISLVDVMEKMELQRISKFYKIPLQRLDTPTDEDAATAAGLRVTALLEARNRQLTGLERERLGRFESLVRQLAEDPEQIPLLALLLDDCYQKNMNPAGFFPAGSNRLPRPVRAPGQARDGQTRDSQTRDGQAQAEQPQKERNRKRRTKRAPSDTQDTGDAAVLQQAGESEEATVRQAASNAPESAPDAPKRRRRRTGRKPSAENGAPAEPATTAIE